MRALRAVLWGVLVWLVLLLDSCRPRRHRRHKRIAVPSDISIKVE